MGINYLVFLCLDVQTTKRLLDSLKKTEKIDRRIFEHTSTSEEKNHIEAFRTSNTVFRKRILFSNK